MTNQENSITAEEYRLEVLKHRFAQRVAQYEDEIAVYETRIAQLQQELENQLRKKGDNVPEEVQEG